MLYLKKEINVILRAAYKVSNVVSQKKNVILRAAYNAVSQSQQIFCSFLYFQQIQL